MSCRLCVYEKYKSGQSYSVKPSETYYPCCGTTIDAHDACTDSELRHGESCALCSQKHPLSAIYCRIDFEHHSQEHVDLYPDIEDYDKKVKKARNDGFKRLSPVGSFDATNFLSLIRSGDTSGPVVGGANIGITQRGKPYCAALQEEGIVRFNEKFGLFELEESALANPKVIERLLSESTTELAKIPYDIRKQEDITFMVVANPEEAHLGCFDNKSRTFYPWQTYPLGVSEPLPELEIDPSTPPDLLANVYIDWGKIWDPTVTTLDQMVEEGPKPYITSKQKFNRVIRNRFGNEGLAYLHETTPHLETVLWESTQMSQPFRQARIPAKSFELENLYWNIISSISGERLGGGRFGGGESAGL